MSQMIRNKKLKQQAKLTARVPLPLLLACPRRVHSMHGAWPPPSLS